MTLRIQIETIIFSFLLGFLTFFLWKIFYKLIYSKKKILKIISSFIFVEILTLFYIKGLFEINNFNLHYYSYFFLLLGFLLPLICLKHCNH